MYAIIQSSALQSLNVILHLQLVQNIGYIPHVVQYIIVAYFMGFPGGWVVKNSPAMQETRVWSLGWEDPLEKEMTFHSSILPGKSHGQRSLTGYSPWGHKESDTTWRLNNSKQCYFKPNSLYLLILYPYLEPPLLSMGNYWFIIFFVSVSLLLFWYIH